MSKLGSLIAIPVGFALVKAIVDKIPEDTTPIVPLIPEPKPETTFYPDLILREKDKSVVVTPIIPTGPIKQPSADIPKFVPFDILGVPKIDKSKLPKGPLPTDFFQTGIFDPAVQAKLRARK